jgi:hypothetical protein
LLQNSTIFALSRAERKQAYGCAFALFTSVWAQAEDSSEAAATAMRILFLHRHTEQVGTAIGNLSVVVFVVCCGPV